MWGKFGLKSIIPNGNLFKFRNNKDIQSIIEMGPWMVNGKPMFVQKWDPSMSLDKTEPSKLPLWVKLRNLLLEAWTTKGINAVASRLGTPLIMDQVTTSMCKGGTGRFGFARVLIDVEAEKGLPDKVEIVYKNRDGLVTGKKIEEFMEMEREELRKKQENAGYEQVRYKKIGGKKENPKGEKRIDNEELKGKKVMYKPVEKMGNNEEDTRGNEVEKEQLLDKESSKTDWNVQKDIINSIRKSANKYAVLDEENKNGNLSKRENENEEEVIDIYDETSGSARKMTQNDIGSSYVEILNGTGKSSKQNAVRNLIADEKLSIYAVLETRMKDNKIKEIRNKVFDRWNWYDNV
ncbi:RNA-directed DNA polymerase, eukaryota, reverse transcriptase zinc-binding domain protein [Tanacetum coccineum]